jgi:hypothetical protein
MEFTNGRKKQYYFDKTLGLSDREMMEPYLGMSDFSEEDIERLCTPHPDQPRSEEEWLDLEVVAASLVVLGAASCFYESMEGDYFRWNIHFADKVSNRQALTHNDWDIVRGARVMLNNGDWEDAQVDVSADLRRALDRIPDVKTENTIFDLVLC